MAGYENPSAMNAFYASAQQSLFFKETIKHLEHNLGLTLIGNKNDSRQNISQQNTPRPNNSRLNSIIRNTIQNLSAVKIKIEVGRIYV